MKRNITVLISILIALIISLSATCVLMASGDDNQNGNNNSNSNDNNSNDDQNDTSNDNSNSNNNGNEVKLYGTISSIDNNNTSFTIRTQSNQSFVILANIAQIKAEHAPCPCPTFDDLQVGHQVKAEGWLLNGALQAYQVEVYNYICPGATTTTPIPTTTTTIPGQPVKNLIIVRGKIAAIIPDQSNPEEGELVVKGQTIEVSSSTKFNGVATKFSDLSVGQKIIAKGKLQTDGKINAKVIRTK